MEAHLVELVLDLFQRFTAKVTNLDHLFLSLADQILYRVDVRTLQAVEAAHGEIQLFDRNAHEVVGLLLFLLHDHRLIRQILRQIGEQSEVVDQDLRGQRYGVAGRHRLVRPDFQRQLVEVRLVHGCSPHCS